MTSSDPKSKMVVITAPDGDHIFDSRGFPKDPLNVRPVPAVMNEYENSLVDNGIVVWKGEDPTEFFEWAMRNGFDVT